MNAPEPKRPTITVGEFYTRHSEALQMKLLGPQVGFDRKILEPTVNRPGLALSGFFSYFAYKRIQVLGAAELSFLDSLPPREVGVRCRALCAQHIPCLVVSRKKPVPAALLEAATEAGVAIFRTPLVTMRWINAATLALEFDFAPTTSEHGSMVDIRGVGVLIRGASGTGKSECVLGLVERGYSMVSDDITRFRAMEKRELYGYAPDITRHHIEIRGIGVINVLAIFGAGAVRDEKRLDLVVSLKEWGETGDIERVGIDQEYYDILGILVPHISIPVASGRDTSRLVEVAALDQKLRLMGHNSALEFNNKLMHAMRKV